MTQAYSSPSIQSFYLDKRSLLEHNAVPYGAYIDPLCIGPDGQLGVLPHALLDDVGDEFHCRPEVLHTIVTQRDIVRKLRL